MKKKFILTLGLCGLLLVTGCTDSNENKDNNKENEENKNYASKVTCENPDVKYILYFDKNDKILSFDAYSSINIDEHDILVSELKESAEEVCNGEGEFRKEWMDECKLTNKGSEYTLYISINNNKWFDDILDKDEIIRYAEEEGLESDPLTCK